MRRAILTFCVMASVGVARATDGESLQLLRRWGDALVVRQVRGTSDPALDGGILCPACAFVHGRIADAVWPLCVLWEKTGEERYLSAARAAVTWAETNMLRPDGSWCNDYKNPWKGTVSFAQIALGKTLVRHEKRLPDEIHREWRRIFERQSAFLVTLFRRTPNFRPVINYPVAYCQSMALAWKVTGRAEYRQEAETMLERTVLPAFLPDGLLSGEGRTPAQTGRTGKGCAFVDFGYNLEESLPSLMETAELLNDERLLRQVVFSSRVHLEMLLPDGAIDDSCGSRAPKWTYYGSRTSDGVLPLLSALARRGEPYAQKAIARRLSLLTRCTTSSGLLAGGLDYEKANEWPCIHHTFTHAKALAQLVVDGIPGGGHGVLPREIAPRLVRFDSIATTLAAIGPWRATFSVNDGLCDGRRSAGNGSGLSLLWHEDVGPVIASTMYLYKPVEPTNFQDLRHQERIRSAAPCIESGNRTSALDVGSTLTTRFDGTNFVATVVGRLADADSSDGAPFEIVYVLTAKSLEIRANCGADFRYVIPMRGGRVSSSRPVGCEQTERGVFDFTPIGGFMTHRHFVEGKAGETVRLLVEN